MAEVGFEYHHFDAVSAVNVGTWRFKETKTALDFFSGDWLPNFLAGTITADPGHPALKPRELTYFRLVTIEPV
jgi:hypothetical protein